MTVYRLGGLTYVASVRAMVGLILLTSKFGCKLLPNIVRVHRPWSFRGVDVHQLHLYNSILFIDFQFMAPSHTIPCRSS